MTPFDAWYLPNLDSRDLQLRVAQFGMLQARVPELTPSQLTSIIAHLRKSADALSHVSLADVITAISTAGTRVVSNDQTPRLLHAATGYSYETINDLLHYMKRDWSAASLEQLLISEFGEADVPTGEFAFHIFSGNVPGVAVTSIIRSLLVRAPMLGKLASGEPVLPVLFARELDAVAPQIAQSLAVMYWPGGTQQLETAALSEAATVVVYGGDEVVRSIGRRARPGTHIVEHGPRMSLGIVSKSAPRAVAREIAAATAAYDQQGCVSPHVIYVERGGEGTPQQLAEQVAQELHHLAATKPRRTLSHSEALGVRQARTRAEFRAIAGENVEIFASDDTSYTVIYDEALSVPTSCLNRTLYIIPIDTAMDVIPMLHTHSAVLQSVALAGFSSSQTEVLSHALTEAGATRITTFEELPWPPMWWLHDGRGPLRELISPSDNSA